MLIFCCCFDEERKIQNEDQLHQKSCIEATIVYTHPGSQGYYIKQCQGRGGRVVLSNKRDSLE